VAFRRWGAGAGVAEVMRAPIVLFVYNRPAHTRQTIAALQANHGAGDSDLFIYSDAAKNADSVASVAQVREYVRAVGGFKSVTIHEQPENRGLARSVIHGVTQITAKYGRAIVLEDDLITAPNFLDYMNAGLERRPGDANCRIHVCGGSENRRRRVVLALHFFVGLGHLG
jgi:GT2 family glycosyltransferase